MINEKAQAKAETLFRPSAICESERICSFGHTTNLKKVLHISPEKRSIMELSPAVVAERKKELYRNLIIPVQGKLIINRPGDQYEQEADRIADKVLSMSEPQSKLQFLLEEDKNEVKIQKDSLANKITPVMQRQINLQEEEGEVNLLQTKVPISHNSSMDPAIQEQINFIRGQGQSLSSSIKGFFESRFGYDFSRVKIHFGAQASKTAQELGASAFTSGEDIVFGSEQYNPNTIAGKRLIAHELTHVIQQSKTPANNSQNIKESKYYKKGFHSLPILTRTPNDFICRFPIEGGELMVSPKDPTLRRVNPIDPNILAEKEANLRSGRYEPISIFETNLGAGNIKIVTDGCHRTQAAINLGWSKIKYIKVGEEALRREAQRMNRSLEEIFQRAERFDTGTRDRIGGCRGGGGRGSNPDITRQNVGGKKWRTPSTVKSSAGSSSTLEPSGRRLTPTLKAGVGLSAVVVLSDFLEKLIEIEGLHRSNQWRKIIYQSNFFKVLGGRPMRLFDDYGNQYDFYQPPDIKILRTWLFTNIKTPDEWTDFKIIALKAGLETPKERGAWEFVIKYRYDPDDPEYRYTYKRTYSVHKLFTELNDKFSQK